MVKESGVYYIENIINRKKYIGSSTCLKSRNYTHWSALKRGVHENSGLQKDCAMYGIASFKFVVIEKVPLKNLIEREEYWIAKHNSNNIDLGYNIEIIIGGKKKAAQQTKDKESNTVKNKYKNGYINPFAGRRHSEESKILIGIKSSQKIFTDEFKSNLLLASNKACFKPVIQYDKNDNFIQEHTSINNAVQLLFPLMSKEEILRTRKGSLISAVCRNVKKTAFGFKWRFKDVK